MLHSAFTDGLLEAGCDEAGRGCLAGPVFAAAVILPRNYHHPYLNDSKKLTVRQRERLRPEIERDSFAWAVGKVDPAVIDEINILQASILAMHKAIEGLSVKPELILVDGNRFTPFPGIRHFCIVKGDAKYLSIAAASVLAKTHRDAWMEDLHPLFPDYDWMHNKGYPCRRHREALHRLGTTHHHRMSFKGTTQLKLVWNGDMR